MSDKVRAALPYSAIYDLEQQDGRPWGFKSLKG